MANNNNNNLQSLNQPKANGHTLWCWATGGEGEYSILPDRGEAELAFNEAGLSEEKLGLLPGTGTGDAEKQTIVFVA